MKLPEIISLINGTLLAGSVQSGGDITGGCGADLMSDVLRYDLSGGLLVTGLANPQVVRTAEMADAAAILLARGKLLKALKTGSS